jgi:hypothetical protein
MHVRKRRYESVCMHMWVTYSSICFVGKPEDVCQLKKDMDAEYTMVYTE